MLLSDTEAVAELKKRVNMDRTVALMTPLQYWLGQRVQMECRVASLNEVGHARRREEDDERASQPETQEAKFIKMMEDNHKLAVSPHADALKIPTFSRAVPPNKNEATFAQWVHEVREAQTRFPESTVRNWISRSLRGPPADAVRSLGPYASIASILNKLQTMHGGVAPFDVMMKKLFGMSQSKGKSVTNYAIRLETTQFGKHYKEPDTASAKAAQGVSPELMEELAEIKAVANKAWGSQQNQKKEKQGESKNGGGSNNKDQQRGPGGPCYGCGGTGHFIKDCPIPIQSL